MDLTIITVTYQSIAYIDLRISSVITNTLKCSYEHIIVDNGSTDGTCELIEKGYLHFVKLIKNFENRGFAAANNRALKEAKGRFLLFLNPDTQLQEGYLDQLIDRMDSRPEIGLMSCKLISFHGVPDPALRPHRFPHLFPYLLVFLGLRPFFCTNHPKFRYDAFRDDLEQEVAVVRGSFMLTRKEMMDKLGFAFDPNYFILFEDVDLCREVKRLGYKIVYSPEVVCIDFWCRSFLHQSKPWKYLKMAKSFKTYVRKWHSSFHLLWIIFVIPFGFIVRMPKWRIQTSLRELKKWI